LINNRVECWFAPEDLKIGDKLRSSFDEAIQVHDKLMVLLSEYSVDSQWVEKEVETAFEKERKQNRIVLFPIRLDDAVMNTDQAWAADIRRTRYIGDFRNWKDHNSYKKAFDRLLRDLKTV
jgi:TIR domain-containing protein